jgi:hypothetical protein
MRDLEPFRAELRKALFHAAGCGLACGIGIALAAVLFFGLSGGWR